MASVLSALGLYQPQYKIERYYRIKHDVYHHTLAPNTSHSQAKWGPFGYKVNTNSLGFKDSSARKIALKSDQTRIVFIGDSFTEGVGFGHNDTFVGQIENSLKNKKIEVLNAAVSSYSPIVYLRKTEYLLNTVGLHFDHLIVFIDISDIQDEAVDYSFDEQRNIISPPTAKSMEFDEKFKNFITENTILLSNLRILVRRLKKQVPHERTINDALNVYRGMWTINETAYNDYGKKGLALATKHMDKLSQLLKEKGIKLSIAVYPWPDQIMNNDLNSKQVTIWKNWAQKNQVGFVNYFPDFINDKKSTDTIKKYFLLGDVHWNEDGHKLITKKMLQYLN